MPQLLPEIFSEPGDHAGEMETSLLMHLCPDRVHLDQAGEGKRIPNTINGLNQEGAWTPRPWRYSHPDLGSGNPALATAEKGRLYFEKVCDAIKEVIIGLSSAEKGDLPYV